MNTDDFFHCWRAWHDRKHYYLSFLQENASALTFLASLNLAPVGIYRGSDSRVALLRSEEEARDEAGEGEAEHESHGSNHHNNSLYKKQPKQLQANQKEHLCLVVYAGCCDRYSVLTTDEICALAQLTASLPLDFISSSFPSDREKNTTTKKRLFDPLCRSSAQLKRLLTRAHVAGGCPYFQFSAADVQNEKSVMDGGATLDQLGRAIFLQNSILYMNSLSLEHSLPVQLQCAAVPVTATPAAPHDGRTFALPCRASPHAVLAELNQSFDLLKPLSTTTTTTTTTHDNTKTDSTTPQENAPAPLEAESPPAEEETEAERLLFCNGLGGEEAAVSTETSCPSTEAAAGPPWPSLRYRGCSHLHDRVVHLYFSSTKRYAAYGDYVACYNEQSQRGGSGGAGSAGVGHKREREEESARMKCDDDVEDKWNLLPPLPTAEAHLLFNMCLLLYLFGFELVPAPEESDAEEGTESPNEEDDEEEVTVAEKKKDAEEGDEGPLAVPTTLPLESEEGAREADEMKEETEAVVDEEGEPLQAPTTATTVNEEEGDNEKARELSAETKETSPPLPAPAPAATKRELPTLTGEEAFSFTCKRMKRVFRCRYCGGAPSTQVQQTEKEVKTVVVADNNPTASPPPLPSPPVTTEGGKVTTSTTPEASTEAVAEGTAAEELPPPLPPAPVVRVADLEPTAPPEAIPAVEPVAAAAVAEEADTSEMPPCISHTASLLFTAREGRHGHAAECPWYTMFIKPVLLADHSTNAPAGQLTASQLNDKFFSLNFDLSSGDDANETSQGRHETVAEEEEDGDSGHAATPPASEGVDGRRPPAPPQDTVQFCFYLNEIEKLFACWERTLPLWHAELLAPLSSAATSPFSSLLHPLADLFFFKSDRLFPLRLEEGAAANKDSKSESVEAFIAEVEKKRKVNKTEDAPSDFSSSSSVVLLPQTTICDGIWSLVVPMLQPQPGKEGQPSSSTVAKAERAKEVADAVTQAVSFLRTDAVGGQAAAALEAFESHYTKLFGAAPLTGEAEPSASSDRDHLLRPFFAQLTGSVFHADVTRAMAPAQAGEEPHSPVPTPEVTPELKKKIANVLQQLQHHRAETPRTSSDGKRSGGSDDPASAAARPGATAPRGSATSSYPSPPHPVHHLHHHQHQPQPPHANRNFYTQGNTTTAATTTATSMNTNNFYARATEHGTSSSGGGGGATAGVVPTDAPIFAATPPRAPYASSPPAPSSILGATDLAHQPIIAEPSTAGVMGDIGYSSGSQQGLLAVPLPRSATVVAPAPPGRSGLLQNPMPASSNFYNSNNLNNNNNNNNNNQRLSGGLLPNQRNNTNNNNGVPLGGPRDDNRGRFGDGGGFHNKFDHYKNNNNSHNNARGERRGRGGRGGGGRF